MIVIVKAMKKYPNKAEIAFNVSNQGEEETEVEFKQRILYVFERNLPRLMKGLRDAE